MIHYDYDMINDFKKNLPSKDKKKIDLEGRSLFIFSVDNCMRKASDDITSHWLFDCIIILLIVISTLTLAFEEPLQDPESQMIKIVGIIDIATTFVFTYEAILKIITHGFLFNGKYSYLRNPWNILDFIIVIFALISLSLTD